MLAMGDQEWAKKNPERHAANQRSWVSRNREKAREYQREWNEANREKHLEYQRVSARRARLRMKLEMIAAYGGKCSCCGEAEPRFLSVEHIGGREPGDKHTGMAAIRKMKAEGWPDGYTCLCFNCNFASWHNGGICPHKENGMKEVLD